MRGSRVRPRQRVALEQGAAGPRDERRNQRSDRNGKQRRHHGEGGHSGTPSAAEPCAAFSALRIQTSPPNAPTMNKTAPNSSETLTPSFVISPAYPNASPMVASRTPQPAIEIGSIVISMTGGISRKIWLKNNSAAIACHT